MLHLDDELAGLIEAADMAAAQAGAHPTKAEPVAPVPGEVHAAFIKPAVEMCTSAMLQMRHRLTGILCHDVLALCCNLPFLLCCNTAWGGCRFPHKLDKPLLVQCNGCTYRDLQLAAVCVCHSTS